MIQAQQEKSNPPPHISLDIPSPIFIPQPHPQQQTHDPSSPTADTSASTSVPGNSQISTHLSPSTNIPTSHHSPQHQSHTAAPLTNLPITNQPTSEPHEPTRVTTRSKNNIHKPKIFFDYLAHIYPNHSTPNTFKQAATCPHWRDAMKAEFDALLKNQT